MRSSLLDWTWGLSPNLGTSEEGKSLVQELGVTYPAGTTPDADVVQAYELIGHAHHLLYRALVRSSRQWTGLLTEDKLVELVKDLIEASAGS